jgi:predicted ATPase
MAGKGPLTRYKDAVARGDVAEDPLQVRVLEQFDRLYDEVMRYSPPSSAGPKVASQTVRPKKKVEPKSLWSSFFSSSDDDDSSPSTPAMPAREPAAVSAPRGIYLWGGVGCGKTFMMDTFYESVSIERKRRIHFDDFMIDIHKRLHKLKGTGKSSNQSAHSLDIITSDLTKSAYLLCFDEFQVK